MISREEVLKLLEYDPATGIFKWKIARSRRVKVGSEAGCVLVEGSGKSYRHIKISGRDYLAHRLIWLILTGQFPNDEIDHIDGNGINNAASNLRAVTRKENAKNHRRRVNNTTGVTGVHRDKVNAKWYASIRVNGKKKHLGRFDNFDEAVIVRKEAEKLYDFHPRHGEMRPL